ncbi:unnamed protein product [Adineta steineri]|uniref:HAT C-terminal dimerisation domain-containing protein n=1 Tax=Adineta steineri TaxID=433720 RepID=A0A814P4F0_9BILA|nr:unnamed protein product [Adineta steineri]CAF1102653.1 unnamed protein product [Adineta steineri]
MAVIIFTFNPQLLNLELSKNISSDINSNTNISSLFISDSSMQCVAFPAVNVFTAVERLKLFRNICGTIDDSTLKQEFANYEIYKKDVSTFTTFSQKCASSLPKLSKMVLQYGTIPSTSVSSESLFSIAGYMARKTRSSLSTKNLKYSIFLKDKLSSCYTFIF